MKKIICFSFIAALTVFNISCKKEEANKLTEFDINYSSNLTVPSSSMSVSSNSLSPTTVDFVTPNIPTQQSAKFSEAGTAISFVDQIKMTKFNISTTTNLDFLKSMTVYIKAGTLAEQKIATKTNIPSGITSIAMDLEDVNIKEFIFKENIQFRVSVVFDATAATDQTLKLDETVHVSAKLIK